MSRKGTSTPIKSKSITLGMRVRLVRKAWGWSQDDLAKALGTDQQVVSYWERDQIEPSRAFLRLLIELFRMPEAALKTGKGFTIPDCPATKDDPIALLLQELQPLAHILVGDLFVADLQLGTGDQFLITKALQAIREARNEGRQVLVVLGPKNDSSLDRVGSRVRPSMGRR